jgi:dTDP-4-dehydrorhamnose 3,5-epimerase
MKIIPTKLDGCIIIQPEIYHDDRGLFFETFQKKKLQKLIDLFPEFVQDNFSQSKKNVLRGLHFQKMNPQGKLVRVSKGSVFDVAVDLRPYSITFKKWIGIELSDENHLFLFIPPGFAHGFLTLSETAHFEYKCTDYYCVDDELCIKWDDPELKIDWPETKNVIVSPKDQAAPYLNEVIF